MAGRQRRVMVEQLDGERRADAWRQIVAAQARYAGYQQKTDRVLPVIRLSLVEEADAPPTVSE